MIHNVFHQDVLGLIIIWLQVATRASPLPVRAADKTGGCALPDATTTSFLFSGS
jgi:hypothetical protein